MSEDQAFHPHQRKDARELAQAVAGGEVGTLMPEHLLNHVLPSVLVEVRPAGLRPPERIPFGGAAGETLDPQTATLAQAPGTAGPRGIPKCRATDVKRNSASSRSRRGSVRASPR